jgi:hypothetical protein
LWIRIILVPGNLDPLPHPHQIKIRIRIKICMLDPEPDPHQFADVKPKCMENEPFFEARIWIRIRIMVKSWIRIRISIRVIR